VNPTRLPVDAGEDITAVAAEAYEVVEGEDASISPLSLQTATHHDPHEQVS
jgi:hypothetical protein